MHRLFLFFVLFVLSLNSLGVEVYSQIGTWKTYTNTNHINDIVSRGDTLWVATSGGLVTFDVQKKDFINTYTNVDGLIHVNVTSIVIDRKGHVWLGTDGGGISKWRRPSEIWRTYTEFDGVALHVRTLWLDGPILWVGTDEGIAFFQWGWDWEERDTSYVWKENYDTRNGLPSHIINAFATNSTTVWVGTDGGVSSALKSSNLKDPSSWTSYTVDDGLPSSKVIALAICGSHVWVGTDRGASFFNGEQWIEGGLIEGNNVNALRVLADTLWAGTSAGVYKLVNDQWIAVAQQSLPSQDVRVVSRTNNGVIFCGIWAMGLAELDGSSWIQFSTEGPWKNNFLSVIVDQMGFVWSSVRSDRFTGKISRFADGLWTVFDEEDGIESANGTMDIMVDPQGRKWFATWGEGVSVLDDKGTLDKEDDNLTVYNTSNSGIHGIPDDPNFEVVTAIKEDNQGNLWFSNYFFGVVVYSPQDSLWEFFTTSDGLVDWFVLSLAIEDKGQIWIGAEQNGVSLFDHGGTPFQKVDDVWKTFDAENNFTNSTVNSIESVEGDTIWFGTNEGLFEYDGELFQRNPVIQNTGVLSLTRDARGHIWVGTSDQGVYVLDRSGNLRVHYDSENSGLVNNTVNDIDVNEQTGEVWMATPLGLSRYDSGVVKLKGEEEKINFFPNPFLPSQGHTKVTFFQLPDDPMLRIYTVSGEMIAELYPQPDSPNLIFWNAENQSGEKVGSGIYVVMLIAPGIDPRIGKLAIVR
ncbi:MAG: hypothetical protein JSV84_18280 [Gemmatimonadota bacterium]|nr:MAG: hypothetical protein JSV84_18280 [Gemmatimonadota bacterium]